MERTDCSHSYHGAWTCTQSYWTPSWREREREREREMVFVYLLLQSKKRAIATETAMMMMMIRGTRIPAAMVPPSPPPLPDVVVAEVASVICPPVSPIVHNTDT